MPVMAQALVFGVPITSTAQPHALARTSHGNALQCMHGMTMYGCGVTHHSRRRRPRRSDFIGSLLGLGPMLCNKVFEVTGFTQRQTGIRIARAISV